MTTLIITLGGTQACTTIPISLSSYHTDNRSNHRMDNHNHRHMASQCMGNHRYGVSPVLDYTPPQQLPGKQRSPRRRLLWIILIAVMAFVVAIAGLVVAVVAVTRNSPATALTRQYYDAVKSQNYATAFQYLDPSGLSIDNQPATEPLYIQAARAFDAQKGKVTDYSIPNISINSTNGVNTAAMTVRLTRSGQAYDVHLLLRQEGNDWKIVSLDSF